MKEFIFLGVSVLLISMHCIVNAQNPKIDSLQNQLQDLSDSQVKADILVALANQHYPSDLVQSIEYAQTALTLSQQLGHQKGTGDSYFILAKAVWRLNNPDQALDYYFNSMEVFREIEDKKSEGRVLNNVGIIYKDKGQYRTAYDYYNLALDIFLELDYKEGVGQALSNIGVIFRRQGNYEKAIEFYIRSLRIKEESEDAKGIAIINGNLGNLYKDQELFKQAEEYYLKALSGFRKLNRKNDEALVLNNLGSLYEQQKLFGKAIERFDESYKLFDKLNQRKGMGLALNNIGSIYSYQNDYIAALKSHNRALEIFQESGQKAQISEAFLDIGLILTRIGRYNEARTNLDKALNIAIRIGNKQQELFTLEGLYLFYEATNDHQNSLFYHKSYSTLKDSLFNISKTQQIAEIQTKYEIDKKEQENELLSEIIDKQKFQNTALVAGSIFLLIFTGFLLVFAVYFYRNTQQKKRTNQLLAVQNAEINHNQKEILRINESLKDSQVKLNQANEELQHLNEGLESKVKQRTAALRQTNQELDTFLYQSSHALRRPVVSVMGLVQLAHMEPIKMNQKEILEKIEHTAQGMDLMLKKLVMASEINMAKEANQTIDFEVILLEVKQNINDFITDNPVNICWKVDEKLNYEANPRLLTIIFQNLMENAVFYHTNGLNKKPEINVQVSNGKEYVNIKFHDNGQGISQESLAKIFDMFAVASNRTPGYGLGLYLVKKAVDKLHGSIEVSSQEDQFTDFKISLPLSFQ